MKRIIILLLISLATHFAVYGQQSNPDAFTWEDFVSIMADNTDDDSAPDQVMFEELYELHLHPLNINTITSEELHSLPFLSDNEIDDIMYYVGKHSPLFSTGELMFITSLNKQKRQMIQLFIYAGEIKQKDYDLKKLLKYSKNELTVRTDIPFYNKEGYHSVPDSVLEKNPNKTYQGNKLLHSLRYTFSSQEHFFAGFQMKKDPGERYDDHFAGYAMIKNIGHVRSAIIGNYRISFGHGLVINTSSGFGKTMKMSSMEIIDRGISRHSSTSESGYLTGAATTLHYGKFIVSAFGSYRKTDATFNNDSSGISSFKTDGLHRTALEISKKGNTAITDFGANIHLDLNSIQLSLTAATTHINHPLAPKYNTPSTQYRYYNPQGSNFSAASISYSYRANRLVFSGETALSDKLALATINQLQFSPNSYNTITLIYRQYQARYNAINARSFGENSTVHNEQGVYLSWATTLTNNISLSSYLDLMYFPWLKYQVYGSSYGIEGLSQLTFTPSTKHSFTLRYRIKSKQKDYKETNNSDESEETNSSTLCFKTNHNLRLQYNLSASPSLSLRTTASGSFISFANSSSRGYSISEAVRYLGIRNLRLDLSTTYFHTDDYDSRITNYEPSLLYSFAMTSYYYHGMRTTFLASWNLVRRLFITVKFTNTSYFNRPTIGTGLELINNNHKDDLQIQVRWKF